MILDFSYHKDTEVLGTIQLDDRIAKLFAIGWLDGNQNFSKGDVPEEFRVKLERLTSNQYLTVAVLRGYQPCAFCGYNGFTCTSEPRMGGGLLLIPWMSDYFVSPDLILHYVLRHQYVPPLSFINAVLALTNVPDANASTLLSDWLLS